MPINVIASRGGYLEKPKLSIHEALDTAKSFLANQEINESDYFVFEVIFHVKGIPHELFNDDDDQNAWVIKYEPIQKTKAQTLYVIIYMNKTTKILKTK